MAEMVASAMAGGPIKIAVMALGGQGGGVLAGWLDALALAHRWHVQTTSVAGVAQRTGATIYYVEMAPGDGPLPVFALSPAKGDVDIVLAAEGMEAGRAILRGFVTPDRTTMIASTHRLLATAEKTKAGDARAAMERVEAAMARAAKRVIAFDMEAIARTERSVISAALFGALAGAGVLPFARDAFEATIRAAGTGIDASLLAFARAHDQACGTLPPPVAVPTISPALAGPCELSAILEPLIARLRLMPDAIAGMAQAGLAKVVDFQDVDYGASYCAQVEAFIAIDRPERRFELTRAAAKHIANAMAYDDVIRVADRKTRAGRARRIRDEAELDGDAVHLRITEYLRPGAAEICGLLPAPIGAAILRRRAWAGIVDWLANRGRRLRVDRLGGFLLLYAIAGLRRWRRGTYRHRIESARLQRWLDQVRRCAPRDYDAALELLECQRLIRGYGTTHGRGAARFEQILALQPSLDGAPDASDRLRRLRQAAIHDEGFEEMVAAIGAGARPGGGVADRTAAPAA